MYSDKLNLYIHFLRIFLAIRQLSANFERPIIYNEPRNDLKGCIPSVDSREILDKNCKYLLAAFNEYKPIIGLVVKPMTPSEIDNFVIEHFVNNSNYPDNYKYYVQEVLRHLKTHGRFIKCEDEDKLNE